MREEKGEQLVLQRPRREERGGRVTIGDRLHQRIHTPAGAAERGREGEKWEGAFGIAIAVARGRIA